MTISIPTYLVIMLPTNLATNVVDRGPATYIFNESRIQCMCDMMVAYLLCMAFPALCGSQHMSFFYLPDEVKYHHLATKFFSLPKDFECDRFELVTAAVRAQTTSRFSEPDFVCVPGEVNPPCILCVQYYASS